MRNDRPQLFLLALAFLMSMFFSSYFGVVGPMIAVEVHLDPSAYGYAGSAFFVSFGLLQMPLGAAFDRFGAKVTMVALMVVAWAGPYLSGMFSADQRISGLALTIVSVVGIATSFAIPVILSKVSARLIIVISMGLATLATAALAASPGSSFVAAVALIALLYSIGNLHRLLMAEAQALMPAARRGVLLGLLNTLVFFGVAISSSVFGWIAQRAVAPFATFQIILAITAISLGLGLAAYLVRPTRRISSKSRPLPSGD